MYLRLFVILLIGSAMTYGCGLFGGSCSPKKTKEEAIENFTTRQREIYAISNLLDSLAGLNRYNWGVSLFASSTVNTFDIGIRRLDGVYDDTTITGGSLDLKSERMNQILSRLKWSEEDLIDLRDALNATNCQSLVQIDGETLKLVFRECDLGQYAYLFHRNGIDGRDLLDSAGNSVGVKLSDRFVLKYLGSF